MIFLFPRWDMLIPWRVFDTPCFCLWIFVGAQQKSCKKITQRFGSYPRSLGVDSDKLFSDLYMNLSAKTSGVERWGFCGDGTLGWREGGEALECRVYLPAVTPLKIPNVSNISYINIEYESRRHGSVPVKNTEVHAR